MLQTKSVNLIYKTILSSLKDLPVPSNISYMWNFGSLLGFTLIIQIISGLLLSLHYSNHTDLAFFSVVNIMKNVNNGWLFRIIHCNGASFFFLFIYFHISRGIYYMSFNKSSLWSSGVTILLLLMATAFLGYVLPWGQMSFWGATVITNLFSVVPFIGEYLVKFLWGGFSVGSPTLNRFYSFHFLLPFVLLGLVFLHLIFLHLTGSSNPLGMQGMEYNKFYPYFFWKDMVGFLSFFISLSVLVFLKPWYLGDPENFIEANNLVTPVHIKPEWYFLFAYAILRCIPNKLGGVVSLAFSVIILYLLPFSSLMKFKGMTFYPNLKFMFWLFICNFLILTWIGAQPVTNIYTYMGQISSVIYFMFFYYIISKSLWDKWLN